MLVSDSLKGLNHSAQGCDEGATLGYDHQMISTLKELNPSSVNPTHTFHRIQFRNVSKTRGIHLKRDIPVMLFLVFDVRLNRFDLRKAN